MVSSPLENIHCKPAYYTGYAIRFLPSKGFDLLSNGIERIKNRVFEKGCLGKTFQAIAGGAEVVAGGLVTAVLGPFYLLGNKIEAYGAGTMRFLKGVDVSDDNGTEEKLLFDINSGLGPQVLRAVNLGGTRLALISNRQRAEEYLAYVDETKPDVVTLQEEFDLSLGEYMARRLSASGYDVLFNVGHCAHGFFGYNSGLFTAVRRSLGSIEAAAFRIYKQSEDVDTFAAKGVLHAKVKVGDSDKFFYISNTHMQAGGDNQNAIRYAQIETLTDSLKVFAKAAISGVLSDDHLLVGDFNDYTEGGAQMQEWLGLQNLFELGEEPNHRCYLSELGFKEAEIKDKELIAEENEPGAYVGGTGVEDEVLGVEWQSLNQKIEKTWKERIDGYEYAAIESNEELQKVVLAEFFRRHFGYEVETDDLAKPLQGFRDKKEIAEKLRKELEVIIQERSKTNKFESQPDIDSLSMLQQLQILFHRRSRRDLLVDAFTLNIDATAALHQYDDAALRAKIAETLATLIDGAYGGECDLKSRAALLHLLKRNIFRNNTLQFLKRNQNDHILANDKVCTTYRLLLQQSHLSDHLGVSAQFKMNKIATGQEGDKMGRIATGQDGQDSDRTR